MHPKIEAYLERMARLGYGPCAKTTVGCLIEAPDGQLFAGANLCARPQQSCPREPGEGYEKCTSICGQIGHAEEAALRAAGDAARGAKAWVYGHTHACRTCQEALYGAGVITIGVRE